MLKLTGCDSTEATVRKRKLVCVGNVVRSAAKRLHPRMMFEEAATIGGGEERAVPIGWEIQRITCINNDPNAFGISGERK